MLLLSLPKNIPFLHTTNGQNTDNFAPCLSVKFARHCKQMSALHFFPKSTEIVVTRVRSTKKLRMRGWKKVCGRKISEKKKTAARFLHQKTRKMKGEGDLYRLKLYECTA